MFKGELENLCTVVKSLKRLQENDPNLNIPNKMTKTSIDNPNSMFDKSYLGDDSIGTEKDVDNTNIMDTTAGQFETDSPVDKIMDKYESQDILYVDEFNTEGLIVDTDFDLSSIEVQIQEPNFQKNKSKPTESIDGSQRSTYQSLSTNPIIKPFDSNKIKRSLDKEFTFSVR